MVIANNTSPKICFIIPSVSSGGIEMYLLRYLNFIKDNRHTTVLVRSNKKGELYEKYEQTGAKVIFMPLGYFNIWKIWKHLHFYNKEQFDIVCDFNANFAGLPMLLNRIAGTQKRITFYRQSSHHFKITTARLWYTNFLNWLVYHNSTQIFSNSAAALNFFFKKEYAKDNKFSVIKNGVELSKYHPTFESKEELRGKLNLPTDRYIIGHVGRFAEAKNHSFILEVAKSLILKQPRVFFVLIGNKLENLLPALTKSGLRENFQILNFQENIPDYLNAFDLFFFPSVTEGQPNALIEAMLSDLPIVTSNIPPIKECLPQEAEICLVDPQNVERAVEKIQDVLRNPEKYKFTQFAKSNFNSSIQFEIFKKSLLR